MKFAYLFALITLSSIPLNSQDQGLIPLCCDDPITGRGEPLKLLYNSEQCYNFEIEGSYLYWQAISDGLDYLYTFVVNGTDLGNNYQSDATLEHAHFDWKSSPRVSVALAGNLWDTKAIWTYYQAGDSQSFSEETLQDGTIGPLSRRLNLIWLDISAAEGGGGVPRVFSNLTSATQANASAKIHYTTADWVAGFSIAWNQNFYMRPYFGVRGAWIKQDLKIESSNIFPTDPLDFIEKNTNQTNLFRGAGLLFGAEGKYRVGTWFSFYGEGAFSVLAGSFKLKQNQTIFTEEFPLIPISSNTNISRPALRPAAMLGAGVNFNYPFYQNRMRATLSGGYEVNYWPYQNQWVRFFGFTQEFKHPGDFIVHGAVVEGALIF